MDLKVFWLNKPGFNKRSTRPIPIGVWLCFGFASLFASVPAMADDDAASHWYFGGADGLGAVPERLRRTSAGLR